MDIHGLAIGKEMVCRWGMNLSTTVLMNSCALARLQDWSLPHRVVDSLIHMPALRVV